MRQAGFLIAALAVRACLGSYLLHRSAATEGRGFQWYVVASDTASYLQPAENLLLHGEYAIDLAQPATRARRLPGYGLAYLVFRPWLGEAHAKAALVVLQVLASGVSVYALAVIARRVFESQRAFMVAFALSAVSSFSSIWDIFLLSESLATSSSILCVHALLRYSERAQLRWLAAAGGLFVYLFMLRSVYGPLLAGFLFFIWRVERGRGSRTLAASLVFAFPFLAFEAFWAGRNYVRFGKVIPSETNYWLGVDVDMGVEQPWYPTVKDVQYHTYRWVRAVGGDVIYYRPGTLGSWLHDTSIFHHERWTPPERTFASAYDRQALEGARSRFNQYWALGEAQNSDRGRALGREVIDTFERFREAYVRERPLQFWVINRLILFKSFVVHSGSQYLPLGRMRDLKGDPGALVVKATGSLSYWFTLTLGLPGLLLLTRASAARFLALWPAAYSLFLLPFVLQFIEGRFLAPAYPFLVLAATGMVLRMTTWREGRTERSQGVS